jgi:hypothetical protein
MTRMSSLASTALVALAAATAEGQERRPAQVTDSVAEGGRRDGRAAAATRGVGGYAAAGAVTGFAAGAVGIPLMIFGDDGSRILGIAIAIPVVWTVAAAARTQAPPPPHVAQLIANRPAAYQEAFRTGYAQRLAQRRRRAATIGGVAGGVVGVAAVVALVVAAFSQVDY